MMLDLGSITKSQLPTEMQKFYEVAKRRAEEDTRTPAEIERDKCNAMRDIEDKSEYDCRICNNRGFTAEVMEKNGMQYVICPECDCMRIRRAIRRMKRSGLEKFIKTHTLDNFKIGEKYQADMLNKAKQYVNDPTVIKNKRWFFIGGQVGSGKTHICTGICRELLYKMGVTYMTWEAESKKLKAIVLEQEEYQREVDVFKCADVLYIDDLFKPVRDNYGKRVLPNSADVKLAFEIINYRYINNMPTIISSEWYIAEINEIDEATASRIMEKSVGFNLNIARDHKKNYRLRITE